MSRHRLPEARGPLQATPLFPHPRSAADAETTIDMFTPTEYIPVRRAASGIEQLPEPGRRVERHRPDPTMAVLTRPDRHVRTGSDGTGPARTRPGRTGPRHRRTPSRNGRRTGLVLLAATAGVVGLPSAGLASVDQCRWQRAAHELAVALDDQSDARAMDLRNALTRAGVGPELPKECGAPVTGPDLVPAPTTPIPSTHAPAKPSAERPAEPTPTRTRPPAAKAPVPPPPAGDAGPGTGTTAAERFGWGTPVKTDNFDGDLSGWNLYDGPGHAGKGRRTPDAASVSDGVLTINGDPNGSTAGMAWGEGQKYGRWEGRVRAPASDESYNALMLLWPDAENFPVGGEVDFMEMSDPTRQTTEMFLHYGRNNNQVSGKVAIDATEWHNWAVEWTPTHIATFVDGKEWFRTTDTSILPPGPMHMTIQLDWFPKGGDVTPSQMQVDWVKQYSA